MAKYFFYIILFFSFSSFTLQAQNSQNTNNDVLQWNEFYGLIIEHHPIARQAWLLDELAKQELRLARGGFDPKASVDFDRKEFKNSLYYNLLNSKLKVPLWIGEIQAGYEQNSGEFLNPENSIADPSGQTSVGIAIPIGQGLIIDARRATLRQAQYFQDIARAEQIKEINKLLINAAKDYWTWYFAQAQYLLLDSAYRLAEQRYQAVKINIQLGELAPIDSIDAITAVQKRNIDLKQAEVLLQNARIRVSNYLWGENDIPLILTENTSPETFESRQGAQKEPNLSNLIAFANENHPEIIKSIFKLKQINVEEKLQRFNLLPRLDVRYNLLRNADNITEPTNFNFQNNYKFGLNFEFPLFLRKERGKLQMVRIKLSQTQFELQQIRLVVENDLRAAYNEFLNLIELIKLQTEITNNYRILRDAEIRKYRNGESTLFLINLRESILIDNQIKLEKQKADYQKAYMILYWTAGHPLWEPLP